VKGTTVVEFELRALERSLEERAKRASSKANDSPDYTEDQA
jgi:hypothetical protein